MRHGIASTALLAGTVSGEPAHPHLQNSRLTDVVAAAIQPMVLDAAVDAAVLGSRALPDAPDGYTPKNVSCPSARPTVRSAASLSASESQWLGQRRKQTVPAMFTFLSELGIAGFDVDGYFSTHAGNTSSLPNVALAFSGGGYRACLNGAGAVKAFDSREANSSIANGGLGGLLQSATYWSGLSGGGWLTGSVFVNNFTTISKLQASDRVWEFQNSIFEGPYSGSVQILDTADYYKTIYREVQNKSVALNTTITDYWGRALSFQLINATDGGPSYTWSSIRDQPGFSAGEMPMPMIVADARNPGEAIVSANASVFEFNPFELGTWDPTTFGFVDLKYLGSPFEDGKVPDSESCVEGFDNAGYVMGTSSSIFNQFLLEANSSSLPSYLVDACTKILATIAKHEDDIASYEPNPFFGYDRTGKSTNADTRQLTLVDGGADLQNIPLQPLIQPVRNVDVIFAIDSSADTASTWPNGTSLVATYERSLNTSGIGNGTAFPVVPDANTFVNLGLNTRPTMFGCNASNTSSPAPLVVYIPNSPYVFHSNLTTFDPRYKISKRDAVIENGRQVATMGDATVDKNWPVCVGCAVLSRSFDRTGQAVPDVCKSCFETYCWNGTVDATVPDDYQPKIRLAAISDESAASAASAASGRVVAWGMLGLVGAAALWLM